jgi:nitroreductase
MSKEHAMENPKSTIHRTSIDVMDAIYNRHAVRNFLPKKVDSEIINQLLDTATYAPSALHEESRAFVVIQNRSVLDRISATAKLLMKSETKDQHDLQREHILEIAEHKEFNIFYNAPALIVICSTFKGPFVSADCWLAAENLMLSALSYDLASCVIGFAVPALNSPEWKSELEIPEQMTAVAPIILGWPAGATLATKHHSPVILKWL